VSCSNGTHASRQFLSFLLRWRQPQPRNRSISKEEERQPRAPPLQLPRLTQRLPLTQRPHRPRRPRHTSPYRVLRRRWPRRALRHTSPHRVPRRKWPHRVTRLRKLAGRARHKRLALRRSSLPVRPAAHPHRRWCGTRRRRGPRRLPLSNSRKSADGAAAVARELRNRASSKIWRSPGPAALPLRHRPGAAAATPRHNKTWLRKRV
jgi:hypothetical protein